MQYIYVLLAHMIRSGHVRVDIPDLDMDKLERICQDRNEEALRMLRMVLHCEDMSNKEKVRVAQRILAELEH